MYVYQRILNPSPKKTQAIPACLSGSRISDNIPATRTEKGNGHAI